MARSSSYDFALSRDGIVNAAFRLLGVLGENQTASAERLSQGGQALNMMVKLWQAEGIALWKNTEVILIPQADTIAYPIGPTGSQYCCLSDDYVQTTVGTSRDSGNTTIVVTSATGMSTGYTIGIETDNGDIHWATLDAIAGTTLTIGTALDFRAAAGLYVYFSTDWTIARPLEIIQAWTRDSNNLDIPVEIISQQEYRSLSNKTTEGRPNSLTFNPTLDNVTVTLWPEPDDMKDRIHMIAKLPFQDFDSSQDNADFPVEWSEALVYNLAIRLAAEYGRTPSQLVVAMALSAYETLVGFSREEVSVTFSPKRREYTPMGGLRR
jgi:hypothetical protein